MQWTIICKIIYTQSHDIFIYHHHPHTHLRTTGTGGNALSLKSPWSRVRIPPRSNFRGFLYQAKTAKWYSQTLQWGGRGGSALFIPLCQVGTCTCYAKTKRADHPPWTVSACVVGKVMRWLAGGQSLEVSVFQPKRQRAQVHGAGTNLLPERQQHHIFCSAQLAMAGEKGQMSSISSNYHTSL
jgi:hypothetical protein